MGPAVSASYVRHINVVTAVPVCFPSRSLFSRVLLLHHFTIRSALFAPPWVERVHMGWDRKVNPLTLQDFARYVELLAFFPGLHLFFCWM
ncbi:hypothetical protein CP532_2852 [Ophiocordyceps camponoti-leonardi (nom. inval.)]|nr:hypothetical protein CP532_2852 [Ophiocordyceps camponoti-leonardi (nom. inval.)]